MRYYGGKARLARYITTYLNYLIRLNNLTHYYEPFVGAASITQHVRCAHRYASDAHPDLILMWQALQEGWQPPTAVSKEEYERLRYAEPSPLRGFVGFACSWSGIWFRSYATARRGEDFVAEGVRGVLKKIKTLQDVEFSNQDYRRVQPLHGLSLVYCDPPYTKTQDEYLSRDFSYPDFWAWVECMSAHCLLVVSHSVESGVPEFMVPVYARVCTRNIHGGAKASRKKWGTPLRKKTLECLYVPNSNLSAYKVPVLVWREGLR